MHGRRLYKCGALLFSLSLIHCAEAKSNARDSDVGGIKKDLPVIKDLPGTEQGDLRRPDQHADYSGAVGVIYVSTKGTDSATCGLTAATACLTITQGISRASSSSPVKSVHVASGTYSGSVSLVDQVNLRGGFSADFAKGPGDGESVIIGAALSGEAIAVKAENLTRMTEVVSFTIHAAAATGTQGKSSYGVFVEDSPPLVLKDLKVISGNGAPGQAGKTGAQGATGIQGKPGIAGVGRLWPIIGCGTAQPGGPGYFGAGGAGAKDSGSVICSTAGGNGGKGDVGVALLKGPCPGENGKPAPGSTGYTDSCTATTAGKGGKGGAAGDEDCDSSVKTPSEVGWSGCPGKDGTVGHPGAAGDLHLSERGREARLRG